MDHSLLSMRTEYLQHLESIKLAPDANFFLWDFHSGCTFEESINERSVEGRIRRGGEEEEGGGSLCILAILMECSKMRNKRVCDDLNHLFGQNTMEKFQIRSEWSEDWRGNGSRRRMRVRWRNRRTFLIILISSFASHSVCLSFQSSLHSLSVISKSEYSASHR